MLKPTASKIMTLQSIQLKSLSMPISSRRPSARAASLLQKSPRSIRQCQSPTIKHRIIKDLEWSQSRSHWRNSTQPKRTKSRAINRVKLDKRRQIWRRSNNHRRALLNHTKNQPKQQNRTRLHKRSNKEWRRRGMAVLRAWLSLLPLVWASLTTRRPRRAARLLRKRVSWLMLGGLHRRAQPRATMPALHTRPRLPLRVPQVPRRPTSHRWTILIRRGKRYRRRLQLLRVQRKIKQ